MKTKQLIGLIVVLILALIIILLARAPGDKAPEPNAMLSQLVNRDLTQTGWQQADPDYRMTFPDDHQAHSAFAVEWWYLTANLQAGMEGRHYGVQFTLFRRGLSQQPAANPWQQPHLYMAHIALTDTEGEQHYSAQRFSRQGPELAGSSLKPLAVWLESWRLEAQDTQQLFPATLVARDTAAQFGYQLQLTPQKPVSLQGEQGFSRKGDGEGASHYYSFTRLGVAGTLWLKGESVPVSGQAWFDHEWTSTTLARGQQGWDWFALQLADGRDLTLFRLRGDETSAWQLALVDAAGQRQPVGQPQMEVLDWWTSRDGVRYPSRWQLSLAAPPLELEITPVLADQEMKHIVRYWEGAVKVRGSQQGLGYMELTGYAPAR